MEQISLFDTPEEIKEVKITKEQQQYIDLIQQEKETILYPSGIVGIITMQKPKRYKKYGKLDEYVNPGERKVTHFIGADGKWIATGVGECR